MRRYFVVSAGLLCGFYGLAFCPGALAQRFQAPDLAIVGEPFVVRLPEGNFQVSWGDGSQTPSSGGLAQHRYGKEGVATVSVVSVSGQNRIPVPVDYAALVRTSRPAFFLERPEGEVAKGPAAHLPAAVRLQGQPRVFSGVPISSADSFSFESWVRVDTADVDQAVASGGDGGFRIALRGGKMVFALPGGEFSASLAGRISAGAWFHLAVLYDRAPLFPFSNSVRVFVDGQPAGEGTIPVRDAGAVRCEELNLGGSGFRGEVAGTAVYGNLLFPLAIWDRVKAGADPHRWPVTVARPGAAMVRVAEPKIRQTVDLPLDPDPAADNGPALRAALAAAAPGTRLRLVEAGSGKAGGKFFIRSLVKEPKWAGIPVEEKTDFELDGNGATLVFSDEAARYLLVNRCSRVAIRNLSFDLDPSYARVGLYAKLLEIDRKTGWIKAQLVNGRDGSPDPIIPRRATYWRWRPHRPDTLRLNSKGPHFRNGSYAVKPKADGSGRPGVITLQLKQKPEDKFWDELEEYAAGDNFYQINNGDFSSNAVSLMKSEDVTFERVNYYATLGMVFLSSDIRRTRVASCVIGVPPGMTAEDRPLSSGSDGYHFHETQGDIIFENNEIALTDDDPISLKDSLWTSLIRIDDVTLDIRKKGVAKGDPVELLGSEYQPLGYRAKVTGVNGTLITLDRRLPAKLEEGTVMVNRSQFTRNWIVRDNYFHDYYGRVMLYTDFGTVVGNRVHNSLYHLGLSTAYFEVAGISGNVVTHRNLFVATDADTSNWGGNPKKVVFHNITYSANSFLGGELKINQAGNALAARNGFYRFGVGPAGSVLSIVGSRGIQALDNLQFIPGLSSFQLAERKNENLTQRGNRAFPGPAEPADH